MAFEISLIACAQRIEPRIPGIEQRGLRSTGALSRTLELLTLVRAHAEDRIVVIKGPAAVDHMGAHERVKHVRMMGAPH